MDLKMKYILYFLILAICTEIFSYFNGNEYLCEFILGECIGVVITLYLIVWRNKQ